MKDNNSKLKERISELELIEDNRREFWSTFWGGVSCLTVAVMIAVMFWTIGQTQGKRDFIKEHQDSICLFHENSVSCMNKDEFSNHYKSKDEVYYDNSTIPNQTVSKH
jgi:hypothetical protein